MQISFRKKTIAIFLLAFLIGINIFAFVRITSFSADNENIMVETNLEKYVNYNVEDKQGTLVQYNVKAGIEYTESYIPIKNTELAINLNKIDGVFPNHVSVITNSTKVTNGKTDSLEANYQYDSTTGKLVIKASNENENGEIINNNQPSKDDRDSYTIICDYDTYTDQAPKRNITLDVKYVVTLFAEDERQVSGISTYENEVDENINNVISLLVKTQEIYNGKIKANIQNETQNATQYTETNQIMISKKDITQKININQKDLYMKGEEDLDEAPIYKTTKISKQDILRILGEEGTLQAFDEGGNLLFTIDKDTIYNKDNKYEYVYEKEVSSITLKTSEIKNEGTLNIETQKEIKGTMTDIEVTNIKNNIEVYGLNEEDEIILEVKGQKINEIKDSKTKVEAKLSNTTWTNEQQNEVTFETNLYSNNIQYNLFKKPTIKIELPSQVEKVVLENYQLMYGNGLELEDPFVLPDENGNLCIVANIVGAQTNHNENDFGLTTSLKISAKIILKKDIESSKESVNITYTNEDGINKNIESGNITQNIDIEAFNQENNESDTTANSTEQTVEAQVKKATRMAIVRATAEEVNGLKLAVEPVKGNGTIIKSGDEIYEGEFIKYNIKIQNTTSNDINNVKVVSTIPDGVTYGNLDASFDNYLVGKYQYSFEDTTREKTINIGTVKAGETISKYYEVKVNDMQEGETEKQITTDIKTYIGETESSTFTINNVIKNSLAKAFLWSKPAGPLLEWQYGINLEVEEGKTATVTLEIPEQIEIDEKQIETGETFILAYTTNYDTSITNAESKEELIQPSEYTSEIKGNTITITTSKSGTYIFEFKNTDEQVIKNMSNTGYLELKTSATIEVNENKYLSNENRILYEFENVTINMTSENEGEEVKYEEEINYNINVTCTGTSNVPKDANGVYVNILDYLPENVKPVSVTYDWYDINYETKTTEDGEQLKVANGFKEKETKTERINYAKQDENGTKLPNLDIYTWVPKGETVNVIVKTTAGYVYEKTEIENSAVAKTPSMDSTETQIAEEPIKTKISNVVKHTIVPKIVEEDDPNVDPNPGENPGENPGDNPGENPSDNPGGGENTDLNKKYSISGLAWNDENQDGIRQRDEEILKDVEVMLIDAKDQRNVKAKTTTNTGKYIFENLEKGNYIIIFKYDTSKYEITKYKIKGTSEINNSDANGQIITLNGNQIYVGVSDIIDVQNSILNLDIGLIEKTGSNLKLDKYIENVTVETINGSKQYSYNNEQLAKVEIKAKEIKNANIKIKYKIVVTNNGKIKETIKQINDYLPEGIEFVSSQNYGWEKTNNGLVNRTLMNQEIAPGESKEIYLVVNKKITEENTGTITNTANIEGVENSNSSAQLIVSVSTGLVLYISIGIITLILVALLVVLSVKYKWTITKISKMGLSILMVILIGVTQSSNYVEAKAPARATFKQASWGAGATLLSGGPTGTGYCANHDLEMAGECTPLIGGGYNICYHGTGYSWSYDSGSKSYGTKQETEPGISLKKTNSTIAVKQIGDNYILGPFNSSSNSTSEYTITVTNKNGTTITGWSACDVNGNVVSKVMGSSGNSFYIKLSSSLYQKGVSKVSVTQSKTRKYKQYYSFYGYSYYVSDYHKTPCVTGGLGIYSPGHQNVYTSNYKIDEGYEYTSENTTAIIEWTDINSTLDIIKVDADNANTKIDIKGTIKKSDGSWSKTFKTQNGKVHFDNLSAGTYIITETINNNYGYEQEVNKQIQVTLQSGTSSEINFKNTKQTGNLELIKQDSSTGKKLENVGFKIKNESGQYIIAVDKNGATQLNVTGSIELSKMQTTTDGSKATLFVTNQQGSCIIYNIKAEKYTVEETFIGENNYGYAIDGNYTSWSGENVIGNGSSATIEVKRQKSDNTTLDNPNREDVKTVVTCNDSRKYIKISGTVWEDIGNGKHTILNGIYKENNLDTNDKELQYVTVNLKDKNGNIISTATTDQQGNYSIKNVNMDELQNYYIEFVYNGLSYQCVELTEVTRNNTSKATEGNARQEFNNKFSAITNNTATSTSGEKTTLSYSIGDHTSTLKYGENSKYGYSGAKFPINNTNKEFLITSNTKDVYNGYLDKIKTAEQIRQEGLEEITNINLGLHEREQPDIALIKDIYSVRLGIKGYEHVYKYGQRFEHKDEYGDGFDLGVKYGSKYSNMTYSRPVYKADYEYISENKSGELTAYITYVISVKNQSTNIKTEVSEIIDYYDNIYQNIVGIGKNIDAGGNVIESLTYEKLTGSGNYQKIKIKTAGKINPQTESKIYVQYMLTREEMANIVKEKSNIQNIAEIGKYSTYDKDGNIYGGIDKNSNPGNAVPGNNSTYEDDTDRAPGFIIVENEDRVVSGKVFDDYTGTAKDSQRENIKTGEIRQGNGKLDGEDTGVEAVTVRLLEEDNTVAKIYDETLEKWKDATTKTDANGDYKIDGFTPGIYKIEYIWGDGTHTVQDYKSTIVDKTTFEKKGQNLQWYKDEFKKQYATEWDNTNNTEIRTSDAVDDYETREAIEAQTATIDLNNATKTELTKDDYENRKIDGEVIINKMSAETPKFETNLEYSTAPTQVYDEPEQKYYLNNIDFGIALRAKQVLELDKQIQNARITLGTGTIISNVEFENINGTMQVKDATQYAIVLPQNSGIKFELSSELIQGSRLEAMYQLQVTNISEKEYLNEEFYKYGSGHGENEQDIVKLTPVTIIDYLDNNLQYNTEENTDYKLLSDSEASKLITDGLLSSSNEMKSYIKSVNTIITTDKLKGENLKPENYVSVALNISKELAASDETSINNDAEIIQIKRNGGSTIITTPGNYIPTKSNIETNQTTEYDDDNAPPIDVIPATGLEVDIIAYTVLALSALGILTAGIILIKKYVV